MNSKPANFIRYNNAVPIAVSLVLICSTMVWAANDDVKEYLISEQASISAVDNRQLLLADLNNFSFSPKIGSITEDEANYYINYSIKTMVLKDAVWQASNDPKLLKVGKTALGGQGSGRLCCRGA